MNDMEEEEEDCCSICPFCQLSIPSPDLQRHANHHFELDDHEVAVAAAARDSELAHLIALAPPIPPPNNGHGESDVLEKMSSLICSQIQGDFYRVQYSLILLLRDCLESEAGNSISLLSASLDHYESVELEDVGWGCGWRNTQMLSSCLLKHRVEAKSVLFGGSEFVPDITSLQRWLEIAWDKGFDSTGSHHFGHKIFGLKKWIGTTECAALLRSFGLRARIVDFGSTESLQRKRAEGKKRAVRVTGPMDIYLIRNNQEDSPQLGSSNFEESSSAECGNELVNSMRSSRHPVVDNDAADKSPSPSGKIRGHQVLMDWVWNYFSDHKFTKTGNRSIIVDKMPLYLQQDGHSRTIVGIQVKQQRNGHHQHNLLIFDPAHRTASLERSLKNNLGWQQLVKRGVHTLKKQQYQLCYVDPGIASKEEMEQLKFIDSVLFEF